MKELVIAEKPSVARDIARVLKCQKQLNGAMEGEKYIVTWGLGHLVTLADPEDYDKKYKEWKLEDLPMMPETFRLEVIRQRWFLMPSMPAGPAAWMWLSPIQRDDFLRRPI